MHIQVNTDRHVDGSITLTKLVEDTIKSTLDRFSTRVTRVEVHLGDENSHKTVGDDKRCLMEARLAGLQPIAVKHQAPTLELAIDGAAAKLERAIDSKLGKLAKR
ncbi:MAG: HPF/RaiA family ribosome-associated protein [Bacteroidetes bacterium]|nr:HPF/RaiA family ribosome-associated protein [Bacteroidota bacterium]MCW5894904.1 HPF/RaiA family ribosome-associated protein [Bacteroidota bacterium]